MGGSRRSPRHWRPNLFRRTLVALLAAAATAVTVAPAQANDSTIQTITGSPLTIYLGSRGELQALRSGETSGFFYKDTSQLGDAGFFLAFPANQAVLPNGSVFGFDGTAGPDVPPLTAYTQVSQPAPTGTG